MSNASISIVSRDVYEYPNEPPFRPSTLYPEAHFAEISQKKNPVYDMVRDCFRLMQYDSERIDTQSWNPLGKFISPGQTVLIKPNMVMDRNQSGEGTDCLYTQPSVVAAVIDYVCIALEGKGKIVIGDAPMQECNFVALVDNSGYKQMVEFYREKGIDIELVDFRELTSVRRRGLHRSSINKCAKGKVVNLGKNSEFYGQSKENLNNMRVTNYDPRILVQHHTGETHEYYVSDYALDADVVINMPKPKSHRKAGVTIALKNLVGINVRKEFLPHHTMGAVADCGDEYLKKSKIHAYRSHLFDLLNLHIAEEHYKRAQLCRIAIKACSAFLRIGNNAYAEGSWYGNHTISRTISDLNKILFYVDKSGVITNRIQRKVLIIADMIISGEKEGPVAPSPKPVGMIAVGENPVTFDIAISSLMGFDYHKIPAIETAKTVKTMPLVQAMDYQTCVASNEPKINGMSIFELGKSFNLSFEPTSGWKGHIEA